MWIFFIYFVLYDFMKLMILFMVFMNVGYFLLIDCCFMLYLLDMFNEFILLLRLLLEMGFV